MSKIVFEIPNRELGDIALKLVDIDDVSYEIDETKSYSDVHGSAGRGGGSDFYHLDIKDWTEVIASGFKAAAELAGFLKIVWPVVKKRPKPGFTIDDRFVPVDKSVTDEELMEIIRAEMEKKKPSP